MELNEDSVIREFLTTASDGKKYKVKYYDLDAIIAVGYGVIQNRRLVLILHNIKAWKNKS